MAIELTPQLKAEVRIARAGIEAVTVSLLDSGVAVTAVLTALGHSVAVLIAADHKDRRDHTYALFIEGLRNDLTNCSMTLDATADQPPGTM